MCLHNTAYEHPNLEVTKPPALEMDEYHQVP